MTQSRRGGRGQSSKSIRGMYPEVSPALTDDGDKGQEIYRPHDARGRSVLIASVRTKVRVSHERESRPSIVHAHLRREKSPCR